MCREQIFQTSLVKLFKQFTWKDPTQKNDLFYQNGHPPEVFAAQGLQTTHYQTK